MSSVLFTQIVEKFKPTSSHNFTQSKLRIVTSESVFPFFFIYISVFMVLIMVLISSSRLYFFKITFQKQKNTSTGTNNDKNRKRKIIWFNSSFRLNFSKNIGKKFFRLLGKYFPKMHQFHKFFNCNNVKVSYSYLPNFKIVINGHNKNALNE